jgi:type I restriction enzyme S subunit
MENRRAPKLRFRGFTDDWEQRKLSDVAEIIGGGTPSTSNPEYWDGDIDWYAPAEIGEQIFANGSIRKITKNGLTHSSAKILPANKTILFTSRAGIGNVAILQRSAATNQGFQSLVCHDDIDPYFVFSMGDSIKTKAERVAAGSTFAEISGKKLGDLDFMFPSTDEQIALGAYFKSLDHLITLHQRKLEKLKKLKKSMLEEMFV